jgi:hypothetical protein
MRQSEKDLTTILTAELSSPQFELQDISIPILHIQVNTQPRCWNWGYRRRRLTAVLVLCCQWTELERQHDGAYYIKVSNHEHLEIAGDIYLLNVSFDHLARRSPTFTTMVSGFGTSSHCGEELCCHCRRLTRTIGIAGT